MLVVSHSVAGCCFDCVCIRSPDFNLFVSGKVVVFFFDAAAAVIVITLLHQLKWKLQNVFHDARHVPRRCRYKRKRQQQYAVLHGHGGQSGWISPEATICALCHVTFKLTVCACIVWCKAFSVAIFHSAFIAHAKMRSPHGNWNRNVVSYIRHTISTVPHSPS